MFAGPEFNIATRTSQVLTIVFSCFLYSGGMPTLNGICFITLFSVYWIDKTLILRHYRKPPFYSFALNQRLVEILPLAVIFHCGFSLYMYGATEIFPSAYTLPPDSQYVMPNTVTLAERIYRASGIINIILIMIGLFFITARFIFSPIRDLCNKHFYVVNDQGGLNQGTYTMELERIKSQGIHSYDIMENENYRPLIISLNSAAVKVARLRKKEKVPPTSISAQYMDNSYVHKSHNEENNVIIQ